MAPPDRDGFWGEPTSTLDWCEENYAVTWYVAEFWNTITNLSMIIPPIYGIYEASRQGFERRFIACYLGLLLVGVGSSLFHMTLKYEMQLLDELPMVWCSLIMIYCILQTRAVAADKGKSYAFLLLAYGIIFPCVYLTFKDPLIMEVMYGATVVIMVICDTKEISDIKLNNPVLKVYVAGLSMYLLGFILWNIDNQFCGSIRTLRHSLNPGVAPLTQLHGYWHLCSGYATYMHTVHCMKRRMDHMNRGTAFTFGWMGLGITRTDGDGAR